MALSKVNLEQPITKVLKFISAPKHSSLYSRIVLRLPLSGSEKLRSKYSLFGSDRYIRLGRVLEDLDALAGRDS